MSTSQVDPKLYSDLPASPTGFYGTNIRLQLKSVEAIKNVIKMYLFSSLGDYGRNIQKGGILVNMLGKHLTNPNAEALKERVLFSLKNFTNIVVNNVGVSLDLESKQFIVSVTFSDTYNKFVDSLNFAVGGL
jgi:hypothetical protein